MPRKRQPKPPPCGLPHCAVAPDRQATARVQRSTPPEAHLPPRTLPASPASAAHTGEHGAVAAFFPRPEPTLCRPSPRAAGAAAGVLPADLGLNRPRDQQFICGSRGCRPVQPHLVAHAARGQPCDHFRQLQRRRKRWPRTGASTEQGQRKRNSGATAEPLALAHPGHPFQTVLSLVNNHPTRGYRISQITVCVGDPQWRDSPPHDVPDSLEESLRSICPLTS